MTNVETAPSALTSLKGKTIVIKYGGNALSSGVRNDFIFEEIAQLQQQGARVLLVHGSGPQISQTPTRLGIESKHHKGLRIADTDTVNVAEMVLCGQISKHLDWGLYLDPFPPLRTSELSVFL